MFSQLILGSHTDFQRIRTHSISQQDVENNLNDFNSQESLPRERILPHDISNSFIRIFPAITNYDGSKKTSNFFNTRRSIK